MEIWYSRTERGEFCVYQQWFKYKYYYFYAYRYRNSSKWYRVGAYLTYRSARKWMKEKTGDPGRMKRGDELPDGLTAKTREAAE
ncbi:MULTISPECIES: hypothetical protein [Bacillus]|uniref:Uncharacterized protein n=1 Tax=Bacillus glycinifermentans TaxID=1664069 RepID=A0AAJ3YYY1_9BACI|nr:MULTISPECIES: hypothetical protein [Bacillus]MDU0069879.1 hypothetical protein [Bacillus sp. IG6]MED8020939.1 hypothetical protein [Bacillus glycinifermentans]QAT65289.1 hypothetical protein EQZ20_10370 [Bacillus glycinifermentans]